MSDSVIPKLTDKMFGTCNYVADITLYAKIHKNGWVELPGNMVKYTTSILIWLFILTSLVQAGIAFCLESQQSDIYCFTVWLYDPHSEC